MLHSQGDSSCGSKTWTYQSQTRKPYALGGSHIAAWGHVPMPESTLVSGGQDMPVGLSQSGPSPGAV